MRVKYSPQRFESGAYGERWICGDCGAEFVKKAAADYAHNQTRAVLADALAERLPPWLAGMVGERNTLISALREAADGGGTCCGGHALSWHYAACRVGKLLRIIGDGETERQVDAAWEAAIYEDSSYTRHQTRGWVIEPVNPVMKTLAGKVAFAQPLLDTGKINVTEYLQVVSTGRLDPILLDAGARILDLNEEP